MRYYRDIVNNEAARKEKDRDRKEMKKDVLSSLKVDSDLNANMLLNLQKKETGKERIGIRKAVGRGKNVHANVNVLNGSESRKKKRKKKILVHGCGDDAIPTLFEKTMKVIQKGNKETIENVEIKK